MLFTKPWLEKDRDSTNNVNIKAYKSRIANTGIQIASLV